MKYIKGYSTHAYVRFWNVSNHIGLVNLRVTILFLSASHLSRFTACNVLAHTWGRTPPRHCNFPCEFGCSILPVSTSGYVILWRPYCRSCPTLTTHLRSLFVSSAHLQDNMQWTGSCATAIFISMGVGCHHPLGTISKGWNYLCFSSNRWVLLQLNFFCEYFR